MADEDDDLDAEFAQFEAQIRSVVSKPKPSAPTSSQTTPPPPTASPPPPEPTPRRSVLAPASTSPPTNPTPAPAPAPAVSGKWKWDGAKWNWVVSTPAVVPASSRSAVSPVRPVPSHVSASPPVLPLSSAPLPAGPSLPVQPTASVKRTAAGEVWRDATLAEWPTDDHRIFVGDLAPDATDAELEAAFSRYASFSMAKVVTDKRTGHCKGYGFVSFAAGEDMIAALKEMNGKYVGSRPVKLKKSNWQKRNLGKDKWKELKLFKQIVKKKNK